MFIKLWRRPFVGVLLYRLRQVGQFGWREVLWMYRVDFHIAWDELKRRG